MRIRAIIPALLALWCMQLGAQNINQTVQVTNEYEARFADFGKQGVDIGIPDSLYRFDYSFDYSVFDSPYRGSYEFTPYSIKVTPAPLGYDGGKLYLRAGAGYSFHPVLDVVYNPVTLGNFALTIFNSGSGFSGRYHGRGGLEGFDGYDLYDSFGVGGHYILRNSTLTFNAGYDGIFAGDGNVCTGYNSLYGGVRLVSSEKRRSYLMYDIGLGYRFGSDVSAGAKVGENSFRAGGSVGPVLNGNFSVLIDFLFGMDILKDGRAAFGDASASYAGLTPHVKFTWGRFDVDAGARLDYVAGLESNSVAIAPVVDAGISFLSGKLRLFGGLDGGQNLNTYNSLKTLGHFYFRNSVAPVASRCKLNAFAGMGGHLGSRFQYQLKGGYAFYSKMPLEYLRTIGFANFRMAYAEADLSWSGERFEADGSVVWSRSVTSGTPAVFAPSPLTVDFRATYNWLRRIYAGASVDAAAARRDFSGAADPVPAYVDLGLYGEYRFSSTWGAWLRLGNMLGMQLERHPGYIEKGPSITAGICLNLKDF